MRYRDNQDLILEALAIDHLERITLQKITCNRSKSRSFTRWRT
jgi:hypothetical protein